MTHLNVCLEGSAKFMLISNGATPSSPHFIYHWCSWLAECNFCLAVKTTCSHRQQLSSLLSIDRIASKKEEGIKLANKRMCKNVNWTSISGNKLKIFTFIASYIGV